jgi:hypothetical protein
LAKGIAAIISGIGTDLLGRLYAVIAVFTRIQLAVAAVREIAGRDERADPGSAGGTGSEEVPRIAAVGAAVARSWACASSCPRRGMTAVNRRAGAVRTYEQDNRARQQ